jgi:hypothetical protein
MLTHNLLVTARKGFLVVWDVRLPDPVRFIKLGDADATQSATLMTHLGDTIACSFGNKIRCRGAAVAQRLSGEKKKINEIERPRVCSPPRATSLKKNTDQVPAPPKSYKY